MVLAAEPLYVLVDTAVVGHLGRIPLAALAVGGVVLGLAAWFGVVIAYGTTGRAARHYGAGSRADAVAEGVQASWLALALAALMLMSIEVLAGPIAGTLAVTHLRGNVATATAARARVLSPGHCREKVGFALDTRKQINRFLVERFGPISRTITVPSCSRNLFERYSGSCVEC